MHSRPAPAAGPSLAHSPASERQRARLRECQCNAVSCDAAPLPSPRKTASILDPSAGSSGAHKPWIPCDVAGLISIFLGRARILCLGTEAPEYLQQGLKTVCETCAVPKGTPVTFPTLPWAYARAKTNAAPAGLDFAQSFHPANSE